MSHDLILRALRLPLLAALCLCIAVVALTAPGLPTHRQLLALDNRLENLTQEVWRSQGAVPGTPERPDRNLPATRTAMATPAVSRQMIDWPTVGTVVVECVAGSGAQLGQWLMTLADRSAESDVQANGSGRGDVDGGTDEPVVRGETIDSDAQTATAPTGAAAIATVTAAAEVGVKNPIQNGYPVTFVAGDHVIKLEPGDAHVFTRPPMTVRFDRGGQFGSATKTLTVGRYEFRLNTSGWDLVAESQ
jgi:hypothetical protein